MIGVLRGELDGLGINDYSYNGSGMDGICAIVCESGDVWDVIYSVDPLGSESCFLLKLSESSLDKAFWLRATLFYLAGNDLPYRWIEFLVIGALEGEMEPSFGVGSGDMELYGLIIQDRRVSIVLSILFFWSLQVYPAARKAELSSRGRDFALR